MKPIALILTLLLAGCAEKGTAIDPAHNLVKEQDGIKLSVTLNQSAYRPDEDVHVHVEATNESRKAVAFIGYNGCDPGIQATSAGYKRVKKTGEPEFCIETLQQKSLAPDQTLAVDILLRPITPAKSGAHTVHAVFQRGQGQRSDHIQADMPFTVKQ